MVLFSTWRSSNATTTESVQSPVKCPLPIPYVLHFTVHKQLYTEHTLLSMSISIIPTTIITTTTTTTIIITTFCLNDKCVPSICFESLLPAATVEVRIRYKTRVDEKNLETKKESRFRLAACPVATSSTCPASPPGSKRTMTAPSAGDN